MENEKEILTRSRLKKTSLAIITLSLSLIAVAAIKQNASIGGTFNLGENTSPYTLSFSSTENAIDNVITTNGNSLTFVCPGGATSSSSTGNWVTLASGGCFYNSDEINSSGYTSAINGMSELEIVLSSPNSEALEIRYDFGSATFEQDNFSDELVGSDHYVYRFNGLTPNYFKITNLGTSAITITSMKLTYSCTEGAAPAAGVDISYYEGIEQDGESVAKQNSGKMYLYSQYGNDTYTEDGKTITVNYGAADAWWGHQFFYFHPYAGTGTYYRVTSMVTSDVAGQITFNDSTFSIEANVATEITYNHYRTESDLILFDVQLGISSGAKSLNTGTGTFSFTYPKIIDAGGDNTRTYYDVSFVQTDPTGASESTTVKSIKVPTGETVTSPSHTTYDGYTFLGWYNGETAWTADTTITEATVFTTSYKDNSEVTFYNVNYYYEGASIYTESVAEDNAPRGVPSGEVDYAYSYAYYSDSDLQNAVTLSSLSITADTDIYIKKNVYSCFDYYEGGNYLSWTNGSEGELIATVNAVGIQTWQAQLNFPLIQYDGNVITTFSYSISGSTSGSAGVQAYYGGMISTEYVYLDTTGEQTTATLTYPGTNVPADSDGNSSKITFELGNLVGTVTLTIYSVTVSYN